MARAIYPHELSDQDFQWLISNFLERNSNYQTFESTALPVVIFEVSTPELGMPTAAKKLKEDEEDAPLMLPPPPTNRTK